MNLIIESENDFVIKNGKLSAKNGSKFKVNKSGDEITVADCGGMSSGVCASSRGGGISISNGTVHINGYKIKSIGSTIIIDGNVDEIICNGKKILVNDGVTEENPDILKDDEYKEYDISTDSIAAISIKGCGGMFIEDGEVLSKNSVLLYVKGSGDIHISADIRIDSLSASIMGSGDISLTDIKSNSFNASIMGSGDIEVKYCALESAALSIMGSGDILFRSSSASNINKSIMGSGDIRGI